MNSSRKSTSGVKSVWVYVVVENPCSILKVPEESFNRASKSEGLVHVVLEASPNHGVTVPGTPVYEDNRVTKTPSPESPQKPEGVSRCPRE